MHTSNSSSQSGSNEAKKGLAAAKTPVEKKHHHNKPQQFLTELLNLNLYFCWLGVYSAGHIVCHFCWDTGRKMLHPARKKF